MLEIRKLRQSEKAEAIRLVWNVFLEFEAPDYSEEGIDAFRMYIENEDVVQGIEMYGAYEDDKIIGTIATINGGSHITLFFVESAYHRRGIGRKLFETVLKDHASEVITVNSSPYAVDVYRRLGFADTDAEQTKDGIRYTPMVYRK